MDFFIAPCMIDLQQKPTRQNLSARHISIERMSESKCWISGLFIIRAKKSA